MALAPRTVQNMPDCLRRDPTTVFTCSVDRPGAEEHTLIAELGIVHALSVALETVSFVAENLSQFRLADWETAGVG
jgi:hypothetical protein